MLDVELRGKKSKALSLAETQRALSKILAAGLRVCRNESFSSFQQKNIPLFGGDGIVKDILRNGDDEAVVDGSRR